MQIAAFPELNVPVRVLLMRPGSSSSRVELRRELQRYTKTAGPESSNPRPTHRPSAAPQSGDAVVTKALAQLRKPSQTDARWKNTPGRVIVGYLRISPHLGKPCNLAPDTLSRRSSSYSQQSR